MSYDFIREFYDEDFDISGLEFTFSSAAAAEDFKTQLHELVKRTGIPEMDIMLESIALFNFLQEKALRTGKTREQIIEEEVKRTGKTEAQILQEILVNIRQRREEQS